MDTGKALGILKGLIYKEKRITFLYCQFSNQYAYIPIQNTSIGSDAIMLTVTEDIEILPTDTPAKVYTENGKELGTVASIEMDTAFNITGILLDKDSLFVKISNVLHMGNIIIIKNTVGDDAEGNVDSLDPFENTNCVEIEDVEINTEEAKHQKTDEQAPYEDEQQNQTDMVNQKLFKEEFSTAVIPQSAEEPNEIVMFNANRDAVESICHSHQEGTEINEKVTTLPSDGYEVLDEIVEETATAEKAAPFEGPIDSVVENIKEDTDEEFTIDIDPRYKHLCGKKLLADITILKETFQKDTLIDAALIQFAIINNAIVKVIMNTDD